jgi:hypothetical protein
MSGNDDEEGAYILAQQKRHAPDFDAQYYLAQVKRYAELYLHFNDLDVDLDVYCYENRYAFFRCLKQEPYGPSTAFDMLPMWSMPSGEQRMYVWGFVQKYDILNVMRDQVLHRLNQVDTEYDEIIAAQETMNDLR